ncbi:MULTISPECIES: hypothetical protein [Novacetimonas]|uniref:Uncharacterized protein n=1 Tax=Novacetimonas hansenii TaxID=436 RepID=A0AAW5EVJ7_NOVHA|nr:hypothetical protein [Novacetimonas hansenii]MCJ8355355.1 hypothetical protein [Novacetimonas hansenii]
MVGRLMPGTMRRPDLGAVVAIGYLAAWSWSFMTTARCSRLAHVMARVDKY